MEKIDSKTLDGQEKTVFVKKPEHKEDTQANIHANEVFVKICKTGIFRDELDKLLREKGLWSDEQEKKLEAIDKFLDDAERKLAQGKSSGLTKLSQALDLIKQIKIKRNERLMMTYSRRSHDQFTVEGQVENAKFDYLTYLSLLDESGDPVFSSYDEYLENVNQPYVVDAARKLMTLVYANIEELEAALPENKFLKNHKMLDEKGRLVKNGKYIDWQGNPVDEFGRRINEDGELVDEFGNRINEDGSPVVENFEDFDDDLESC